MERKKLILKKDIIPFVQSIPLFTELSAKHFWPLLKSEKPELLNYFPDYGPKQLPDKMYLLNILNTEDHATFLSMLEQSKILERS